MKHVWGLLLVIGCGTSGEPMKGDIMYAYGTSHPKMVVGSAVVNKDTAGEMLVQLGDDNVDCGTNFNQGLVLVGGPDGTFVYFSVNASSPGMYPSASISAQHSNANNTNINEATGMVTIDTVQPRVTGSLTFSTTDQNVGPITITGNFDVKRCF